MPQVPRAYLPGADDRAGEATLETTTCKNSAECNHFKTFLILSHSTRSPYNPHGSRRWISSEHAPFEDRNSGASDGGSSAKSRPMAEAPQNRDLSPSRVSDNMLQLTQLRSAQAGKTGQHTWRMASSRPLAGPRSFAVDIRHRTEGHRKARSRQRGMRSAPIPVPFCQPPHLQLHRCGPIHLAASTAGPRPGGGRSAARARGFPPRAPAGGPRRRPAARAGGARRARRPRRSGGACRARRDPAPRSA